MRLTQGTSGKGFKGIHEDMGRIRRPLLPFTKHELEEYAHQHNLSYVEDETKVVISFEKPCPGVAPGQASVIYNSDQVIGGGWILENLN